MLSKSVQEELLGFFDSHDIHVFGQDLRRLFIDYLDYGLRTAIPLYFDGFLYPFNELLDLLDKVAEEKRAFDAAAITGQQPVFNDTTTKEKVIAFLKASLSPEKLFLLNEQEIPNQVGNDGRRYFDLLAVLPESAQTNFNSYEQVISMANIEHAAITVSLHKAAALYKQLEEGHVYYSIACTTKNCVYDKGSIVLPGPSKPLLQGAAEKASAAFYGNCKRAAGFLEGANDYYKKHDNNMTAFMLHQSVELVLRGLVTALLGSCAKTHCFKELKKPLKRCAPQLPYIISNNDAEENRLLHLLEKAYLESRYADTFEISDNDMELLMEAAKTLQENVNMIFKEKIKILIEG